jgi:hypothetical protein
LGNIGTNFEEIKAELKAGLEEYKNMVFTEDTKAEAQKTVASLRKLKKSVNDKKLEVKKSFMAPYTSFEAQVKELDKLIDEPIAFINEQVEEFEHKRVKAKRALISEIYTGIVKEHGVADEYLPLERIYDRRWENATTSQKAITEAITARVEHVEKDLGTIRLMNSEFEDKGLAKYKETLELSDAIETMNQYQKQKEEIIRREKEREERIKTENATATVEAVPNPVDELKASTEEFVEPKSVTDTVKYEVIADPFQIAQLESAMREYGIKFRRV